MQVEKPQLPAKESTIKPVRKTMMETALEKVSTEKLTSYIQSTTRYASSTVQKHAWSVKLYEAFCKELDVEAWPLQPQVVAGFITFLRKDAHYAPGSIEDVLIPSLKRVHEEKTGEQVCQKVNQWISEAIKSIKRVENSDYEKKGKEPAILADVKRIIDFTPEGLPTKAAEASLWLVALCTGARAITCSNVQLRDILAVINHPQSPPGQQWVNIQLRYRVNKGNANWNHEVTLEGRLDRKATSDFAYWLNQHLKSTFNLDLAQFRSWTLTQEQKKESIWHWSKDSMRQIFKDRAERAGFPREIFGFHSLRAGFICSALIKAGSDETKVRSVLENTAFIAGWVPYQNAQLRYVKTCAKKTLISTRLVVDDDNTLDSNIVDPLMTSSENFHSITLADPSWPMDTNYRAFHAKVDTYILSFIQDQPDKETLKLRFWSAAYKDFVKSLPQLEEKAAAVIAEKTVKLKSSYKSSVERGVFSAIGRDYIANQLFKDFALMDQYVASFQKSVDTRLQMEDPFKKCKSREKPVIRVENPRPIFDQSQHRVRLKWTEEEIQTIVHAMKARKNWVEIAKMLTQNSRTNVDCKDKWRNMIKQYGSVEKIFEEFQ